MKNKMTPRHLKSLKGKYAIFALSSLSEMDIPVSPGLPFSIKILLENALRHFDGKTITLEHIKAVAGWRPRDLPVSQIFFFPARVVLQDFTGVPCLVDLAAMRSAMIRLKGESKRINPSVPCDLIIDHSLQVDFSGSKQAFAKNLKKEFARNKERYRFLKWAQNVFKNLSVVPPATGIIHQVNLEYLAVGVRSLPTAEGELLFPDTCIGTDSHTTMINCLGVLGWGVGGIEAEAVMLGEPLAMLLPEVIGVRFKGQRRPVITATDVVLTVTEQLRARGVVGKFVEFFGPGLVHLSLADRSTISNMAPEYGATVGFFPVDRETLKYYLMTGRHREQVDLIERYMKEQGLFYSPGAHEPEYTDVVEIDLSEIQACVAGPKRPQDRIPLNQVREVFSRILKAPVKERGYGLTQEDIHKSVPLKNSRQLSHGSVVLASITSCTNTSNPDLLIGAGLLARNAVKKGLVTPPYVKTSLAPGSQVVTDYLEKSGLERYLEKLGFHNVGYGCATCIGNSGPLSDEVSRAIPSGPLVAASVLSGNRNFEGRIHPLTRANFLASPLLVVAYALAGTVSIDLDKQPLGIGFGGKKVYLKDIWPSQKEIQDLAKKYVTARSFARRYKNVAKGDAQWNRIKPISSEIFKWNQASTYIQEPPFFEDFKLNARKSTDIMAARVLVVLGDSVTTDHISPAGNIPISSPAGQYLISLGVQSKDFNSYGSRRGNDRVMTRGTFANSRLRNLLVPDKEGGWTVHFPSNETITIYDASVRYTQDKTPLIILAGKEYGTGSSRDWAAKGTALLGVRAVVAQSFERIHRSNLVGMGVLPLCFKPGESVKTFGIKGDEILDFSGIAQGLKPRGEISVTARSSEGKSTEFKVTCAIDTPVEIGYYENGGILPSILRKLLV